MTDQPYNPLEKANLARSIQAELLKRDPLPLGEADSIKGAGIYVIYYAGRFAPYAQIRKTKAPIYIGKAIPKGGRKGGLGADASKGRAMADRLSQHAQSIDQVSNLELKDFQVSCLMVDDIWIPLGETDLGIPAENQTSYPAPGQMILYPGGISETEILLAYGGVHFASKVGQPFHHDYLEPR